MKKILSLFFMLFVLCSFGYADLTDSIKRVWQFDETSGTKAEEILRGDNLTVNWANYSWVTGKSNNALNTTQQQVACPTSGNVGSELDSNTTNVSIGGWVKIKLSGTNAFLVTTYNPTYVLGTYIHNRDDGSFWIQYGFGNKWFSIYSPTGVILNETWFHFIITKDGNDRKFYIDGVNVLNCTFTPADGIILNFGDGASGNVGSGYTIYDEWYMWNRTLTDSDVSDLYTSGDGFYYPFTVADTTPPTYSNFQNNNSEPLNNSHVNWSINFNDDTGLSHSIFYNNKTNTNVTETTGESHFNIVEMTDVTENEVYCAKYWVNDTSDNWNETGWNCVTIQEEPDTTPPTYSNFQNNNSEPLNNSHVNWSINFNDDTGLSHSIFYNNKTNTNVTETTGESHFNIVEMTDVTAGDVYCSKYWVNDTSDNWNETGWNCVTIQALIEGNLNIFFENSTENIKLNFSELEKFKVLGNYTYTNNNSAIPDGNCSAILDFYEDIGADNDFFLNASGYTEDFTIPHNGSRDIIYMELCHNVHVNNNFTVNISCSSANQEYLVHKNLFPICSKGSSKYQLVSTVCSNDNNINLKFSTEATESSHSIRIRNLVFSRQGSYAEETDYNPSSGFYESSFMPYYYEGSYSINVNCTHNNTDLNKDVDSNITIMNIPPEIHFSEVLTDTTRQDLTNNTVLEFFDNIWEFFISAVDKSITEISYEILDNESNVILSDTIVSSYEFPEPLGFWRFEEGSGSIAYDSSKNKINGTLTNGANYTTSKGGNGTGSYSINFDGVNDYIYFGNKFNFERNDSFSIGAWIKTSSSSNQIIISKIRKEPTWKGWWLSISEGSINFALDNIAPSNILNVKTTSTAFADGQWHYVIATYDGSSTSQGCHIYVDNIDKPLTTVYNTLSSSILHSSNFQISGYDGTNYPFNGDIDEAVILSSNLTVSEIANIYNYGFTTEKIAFEISGNSSLFTEFKNPYLINFNASDSEYTISESLTFIINDTVFPYAVGIDNTTLYINDTYNFDVWFYDENFYSYNVSCDNGYSSNEHGLNTTAYHFTDSMNITSNTTCYWEYCDGHTDNKLKKHWNVIRNGNKHEFRIANKNKNILEYTGEENYNFKWEKKEDRIEFDFEFPETQRTKYKLSETYTFRYYTSNHSNYFPSEKYPAWIVDSESKTWFDMTGIEGKIDVFIVENGVYEITVTTNNPKLKFKSIGELNCIEETQYFTAIPRPIVYATALRVGECPESLEGVLVLFFIATLLLAFFITNILYLRIPAVNIPLGLGIFFVAYSLMGCAVVVGIAVAVFGLGMIISAFMEW